jgi:beta-glucosidase
MKTEKIKALVQQMTLEEKAAFCSGSDFWHTKSMKQLGIEQLMMSDGPHGLRKQNQEGDHLGMNDSIKAVCFPAGCAMAASFDRNLLQHLGDVIGQECQAEGVGVVLGPAMNIKRSPVCGRNFEYYSEDPYLSTELATAYINGVQKHNVGTSPKHFLANNQEHRRMTSSSELDERTLREIYLASFEGAVKNAKPWTIMASYNKINGTYATENKTYLTDILRKEWGFDGYAVSDWGAVNNADEAVEAGLDLEMPSSGDSGAKRILKAVKEGTLSEEAIDAACENILNIVTRFHENREDDAVFDLEKDHDLAAEMAKECMVLLKNDGILPINESAKVAFIGHFAKKPRFQGGGSSHINCAKITSAMDYINGLSISYAQGFDADKDQMTEDMKNTALQIAKASDIAVLFLGLPDAYESEGYDRKHMSIPACQLELIDAVAQVQSNLVVVLHNGSPIEMPWLPKVKGVLECYLSGEALGKAQVDILFGRENPSGRLPETFPLQLEHNPSYPYYGGEEDIVEYREGVFVGYRYYETKKLPVLFPFGYGLSYTEFTYTNLKIDKERIKDTEEVRVSVDVENTGGRTGKEVVQLYVMPPKGKAIRPIKELKGFEKVELKPGEKKTVTFVLSKRSFAYWNTTVSDWYVESGVYKLQIGKSVAEVAAEGGVQVDSSTVIPKIYNKNSTIGDLLSDPNKAGLVQGLKDKLGGQASQTGADSQSEAAKEAMSAEMIEAMTRDMPIRSLMSFAGLTDEMLEGLLSMINS